MCSCISTWRRGDCYITEFYIYTVVHLVALLCTEENCRTVQQNMCWNQRIGWVGMFCMRHVIWKNRGALHNVEILEVYGENHLNVLPNSDS